MIGHLFATTGGRVQSLLHPYVVGLGLALLTGLAAALALGFWRRETAEASAGLRALCSLKWRDYAHLVEDLLRERGFQHGEERLPGEDGFDLMMTRGTSRYLVECKNSAAQRVTVESISELGALIDHQGAGGAVLATTGQVDPAALALASSRRVEILSGPTLWRQIKPFVPHELRLEAEAEARSQIARRGFASVSVALLAGVLGATLMPGPDAATTTRVDATASPATRTAPAPASGAAPEALGLPPALPDASLTEEQLAARRASAALELRGNPLLHNATWATKSTLVLTLRQAGGAIPDALFDEACRTLVQFEELRYTRVQIESPATEAGSTPNVRWRQCR